ncbi:MAG: hypothetical protein GX126_10110 [Bacteroidales bacterium]|jgi:hypothetical protein|nr:hypothetical protein [Bacteroidales bacterium]
MKIVFGTVLVFLGNLLAVTGQVITEQEMNELLNSRKIQIDNPIIQNQAIIRQVQDENKIITIQEQQGNASNHVFINQDGTENLGYIGQSGSELETRLWQYNSNNEANLWLSGDYIQTSVKQQGDGNVINSYIENTGIVLRSASLLQEGNNNRIDLSLKGDGFGTNADGQTAVISQYGNQHEVMAIMEPFIYPLEINQTPGINGAGMKISISTSTFDFPMKK